MALKHRLLVLGLLMPALAGCATTAPGAGVQPVDSQLQERVSLLEAQLRQQQNENTLLRQQLAKVSVEKKEVRMPNGKEIQLALKKAGYYKGEVDGQIGSQTKEAVRRFQAANGLNPDGAVGSRTWQSLSKYLDTNS